jgi:IS5 family transposase
VTKINVLLRTLSIPDNSLAQGLIAEMKQLLPVMEQIVNVAERNYRGEKVPVDEKVLSLFEPHTELIMRGRRKKTDRSLNSIRQM